MKADAAIYQRVSDGTDQSVEQQNAANAEAARGFGWRTVSYSDAVSASRFSNCARPDWDRLTADVQAGQLRYVVMWESSRGDRKLSTWAAFLDACRDTGTAIYVTSHGRLYDMRNGRDWRALAEDGVDSAYESEKNSTRSRRGVAGAASQGLPYGRVPYGYQRSYERIPGRARPLPIQEPRPDEAPIVREIIGRIAASESIAAILRDLDARGVTTRSGGKWSRSSIGRLVLEGVVYIGKRRHNGAPLQDGNWPAIVDEDVYWRAVAVLKDPARKNSADHRGGIRPGAARWLLSYIAVCDKCGSPLNVTSAAWRGEPYYRCASSRGGCAYAPVEWMDRLVTAAIVRWCGRPGVYEAITGGDDREALAARDEAEAERARLAGFEQQAIDRKISDESFARIAAGIEARIAELDRRANELSTPPVLRDLLGDQEAREEDIYARWLGMPVAAQRRVVAAISAPRLSPTGPTGLRNPFRVSMNFRAA